MRTPRHWMALLALAAVTAACSSAADSTEQAVPAAQHAEADADAIVDEAIDDVGADAMPEINSAEDYARAIQPRLVPMAASLAAGTEFCGLSTRAEAAAAIPKMKAQLAAQGADSADVERQFWAAYDATLARARMASPAETKVQCDQLRAMSDPAEVKKWEQAAKDMEALAEQMKAQGR